MTKTLENFLRTLVPILAFIIITIALFGYSSIVLSSKLQDFTIVPLIIIPPISPLLIIFLGLINILIKGNKIISALLLTVGIIFGIIFAFMLFPIHPWL